ncbi:MBL fold metallo-hydrolase [Erwinia sp. OLTSP20]|uniref:MBL fold metallo-hydrolase n=1 Tax=unclassified Erwinia TaxID=2622719 RepID=UPI000C18A877|nr:MULTISPECIES: MBL fold metallo-hydrolase [unclassified Erwinia]PIJ51432.1 MBL fold metallo-hydrolase [Erwinia sp. OAMSP11]PIJ73454.1 MBL fold metallo-hydrolase [Erwinia sp. OLSSP12]PIJ85517.1 MBL fold metallo-hydrolase [Erwinia sp. OLCASP19]PIJ85915.1 MBL fold metallo-hydrolase [Erwinia sp. OLMTSP26]PIJ87396.1 MBL fold metallo-hydrolase [Erwinia sp. OLMDSP33]
MWKNPWYNPDLEHHTAEGFRNPEAELRKPGDIKKWRTERKAAGLPRPPAEGYPAFIRRWFQPADLSGEQNAVWWLGHAAVMLRLQGRYILIDPALSSRASPLSFYGPQRKTPAPVEINALPELSYVVISHNHYDHLDRATIKQIIRRFPQAEFMVPLGLVAWFQRLGASRVTQLDWWQSAQRDDLTFQALPARHWSMRTLWDRNRSLWCGWRIAQPGFNFWFSGDSGNADTLLTIVQRLGPFTLLALPVGAYAPKWFMQGQHMDPAQAVRLFEAAGCPLTIPIHWGVFELADESLDEPPLILSQALQQAGLPARNFQPWKIGQRQLLTPPE